ncbi:MAG: hypothetical protein F4X40_02375 [Chloroflexi bacterium]|nr:hypothetical protein [Chloroflexota bacterium]
MSNEDHKDYGQGDDQVHKPGKYNIVVDQKPHDWPEPFITGAEIKVLARVDGATFDAWLDVPGPEDELVEDTRKVDLTKGGIKKFYTIKKTTTEG